MTAHLNLRQPVCQLTANDQPLNALITSRIINVSVTDNRASEADELAITLDDHDGALELPKRGVILTCRLGWSDGTFDMGRFSVDETEWAGTPDTITIKARSADFKSPLKTGKRKSYHQQTFGQVAKAIAGEHALTLVMVDALQQIDLGHIDQTDESDLNLLTRLAHDNGAALSIKQGRLLIFTAGQAQTASGKTLPTVTLTRRDGDQFRYSEADRDSDHTAVAANWHDPKAAKQQKAKAGQAEGKDAKVKQLKGTYATEAAAQRAAAAELSRIKRQQATFSMTTAYGRPDISSESPVRLQGFKPQIDRLNWIVAKATHSYSSSGLTSSLELEANV